MREDTNNNILHNYQREVLLTGIRESPRVCQLLQDELGLHELFTSGVTERNSRSCFDNQIFLIAEALREHSLKSQILSIFNNIQPRHGASSVQSSTINDNSTLQSSAATLAAKTNGIPSKTTMIWFCARSTKRTWKGEKNRQSRYSRYRSQKIK